MYLIFCKLQYLNLLQLLINNLIIVRLKLRPIMNFPPKDLPTKFLPVFQVLILSKCLLHHLIGDVQKFLLSPSYQIAWACTPNPLDIPMTKSCIVYKTTMSGQTFLYMYIMYTDILWLVGAHSYLCLDLIASM